MSDYSTYLFAVPTLAEGVGRLVDFGNSLSTYNTSPTTEEADEKAMALDWWAVGADLRSAMSAFGQGETPAQQR